MSFITKGGGVTNLSGLTIDVDKDWQAKGISNLKELALAMVQGDLVVKGAGGVLVRLPAGVANLVLTSGGPGVIPTWQPGGLYLNRFIPASIYSSKALTVVAPTPLNKTAPLPTQLKYAYTDDPADLIPQIQPSINSSKTVTAAAPDGTISEPGPVTRQYDLQKVVDGAVAEDTPAQVTETAAAQSRAVNDMTLLPAVPAPNDAYYFGFNILWNYLILNIGIAGAGVWTITWEYWNGAWVALGGVTDGTTHFRAAAGLHNVTFTRPGDWALTNVNAAGNMYWIRGRVSAYTSVVTQPKGTQAWCVTIT